MLTKTSSYYYGLMVSTDDSFCHALDVGLFRNLEEPHSLIPSSIFTDAMNSDSCLYAELARIQPVATDAWISGG